MVEIYTDADWAGSEEDRGLLSATVPMFGEI